MERVRTTSTEQYRVTYWRSEQGLPQNTVACLLQTRDGYLWIGTRYGLARFDGVKLTDFSAELSELSADELDVRGLAEDTEGHLWLHTVKKLVRFDQGRFRERKISGLPPGTPLVGIAQHSEGGVWVASEHLLHHVRNEQVIQTVKFGEGDGSDENIVGLVSAFSKGALVRTRHGDAPPDMAVGGTWAESALEYPRAARR